MSKKRVYQGQSLLDKAIENTGNVENAFATALLNAISVTDDLVVGQELHYSLVANKTIADYFGETNKPATGIVTSDLENFNPSLGIGTMTIGSTFIIR